MFENYLINAEAYCNKEKVRDPILGEYSDPDEKLMRSIEELINVPINSVKEFRQGIFVQQSGCLKRGEEFTFKTYPPLREAIEKKLMSDLKNVVTLALADPTKTLDRKLSKRRKEALDRLMARGDDKSKHCEHCAKALLAYVGEVLRREG
jgi:serine protein kinase